MSMTLRRLLVLLITLFLLIDSFSAAASTYKRKPDTINDKVTILSSPTTDQHPSPTPKTGSLASTHKTGSSHESPLRLKRSHQPDVSVAANTGAPPFTPQNDSTIASTVNSSAAHVPLSWRAWLPTLGTIVNSAVHIIIMILGILNISINPRVHGEKHEKIPERPCS